VIRRNAVEWTVLGISILAIAAVVLALVLEGLHENSPADPRVELRLGEARQGALGWIVPATVTNAGDEAAEVVIIQASATVAGEEEAVEVEIDFLPSGTDVEVGFVFSAQPEGEIEALLLSFRSP
jgi:uncharacterized protein (TIGR02588 family)